MRRIVSAGLALFIPVTASLALSQPQPPPQQPGKQSPSKQQPNQQQPGQQQPGQKQQNPQRPNQPNPQPFRQGLPPSPRLPDRQPAPPQAHSWLPNFPNPNQRPPVYWLPPQLLPPVPLPIDPAIGAVANLNGNWYFNGDPGKPARIVQWRLDGRAIFINENGTQTWGSVGPNSVWIPEWTDRGRPGLVGVIRGDRLIWPDGNFWSRTPLGGWFWDR